jgi:hypothetical protein
MFFGLLCTYFVSAPLLADCVLHPLLLHLLLSCHGGSTNMRSMAVQTCGVLHFQEACQHLQVLCLCSLLEAICLQQQTSVCMPGAALQNTYTVMCPIPACRHPLTHTHSPTLACPHLLHTPHLLHRRCQRPRALPSRS